MLPPTSKVMMWLGYIGR